MIETELNELDELHNLEKMLMDANWIVNNPIYAHIFTAKSANSIIHFTIDPKRCQDKQYARLSSFKHGQKHLETKAEYPKDFDKFVTILTNLSQTLNDPNNKH